MCGGALCGQRGRSVGAAGSAAAAVRPVHGCVCVVLAFITDSSSTHEPREVEGGSRVFASEGAMEKGCHTGRSEGALQSFDFAVRNWNAVLKD